MLVSALRPNPESYESAEWLWSIYREGDRWHALIHNEFHDPIASTCSPGNPMPGNPCTYLSVTYAVSTDGARSFLKPSPPVHVLAPAPNAWAPPANPLQPGETVYDGYQMPSNVMRMSDGYYYALFKGRPARDALDGMCAMRTRTLADPASWRTWDGSGYNLRMTSPYATGAPAVSCTRIEIMGTGIAAMSLV